MPEQTNAELIAEARTATFQNDFERAYHGGLVERLAERLEAAEQRAVKAEGERDLFKREQVRLVARCDQAQNERNEYAAVVEKVRAAYTGADIDAALATAPADALRELKADVWDEGAKAGWAEHEDPGPFVNDVWDAKTPNPYRAREEQE